MLRQSLLFFFLFVSISVTTQEYQQEDVKTRVRFKIKNFGVNVEGQFARVKVNVFFDSKDLNKSSINSKIEVNSITTGIESRDEHILEEDYFDEPNFKNILLKSKKIEKSKEGDYTMIADLTIKGTTKELKIPLEIKEYDNTLSISSNFEINRKDFKVGGGSFIMSKKVKIEVQYTGTKSN